MTVDKALPAGGDNSPEEISDHNAGALELELQGQNDNGDLEYGEPEEQAPPPEFDANLAEHMDEGALQALGRKLVELYNMDERSRKDWRDTYMKGLDLLGLKTTERTVPWAGACGVWHPVLIEAVVRFQAQAIMEIFPASGPVKTKILGKWTDDKEAQAQRVQQELNYFICDKMTEFRPETEMLLFYLALAGSAFRKNYYDELLGRPVGRFIPAEDFVVPYGTTDLKTCPRYTEVIKCYPNHIRKLMRSGMYRQIDLPEPVSTDNSNDLQRKYDKLEGQQRAYDFTDERHTILEMHVDLDLDGFEDTDEDGNATCIELPYVVTIDKDSEIILAIRRNWEEDDKLQQKILHYVPYHYLPGLGFYGSGLIHLIGGIAHSATSILRQLIDAGTLSNLPGGLKTRGLRIKGDDTPIMSGEFRDVDVPMGSIKDNITFLPYKEPSTVLMQLLGSMVEEGRKLGAAPDLPANNMMQQQAPVGTTLALLEQSMKVMSAVQARLHASLKDDFKMIAKIIKDYMPPDYEYEVEDDNANRHQDFSSGVDIIPVSDPNAASLAQRVVQYQAALDLARQDPQSFDRPQMYKQMLEVLGLPNADKLVKDPSTIEPLDPVSENEAILTGKPVKAFPWQDQEAHIQVHMAALQDPQITQMVGQSPQAPAIMGAMVAHVTEHLAFKYRKDIEQQLGTPLPPEGPLPPEVEVQLSRMVAEAAQRLLQKDQAQAQQQQMQQQAQDPVLQLQQQELALKQQDLQRKTNESNQKLALEHRKLDTRNALDLMKQRQNAQLEGARLGVDVAKAHQDRRSGEADQLLDASKTLADLEFRHKELRQKDEQHQAQLESQEKQAAAMAKARPNNGSGGGANTSAAPAG